MRLEHGQLKKTQKHQKQREKFTQTLKEASFVQKQSLTKIS